MSCEINGENIRPMISSLKSCLVTGVLTCLVLALPLTGSAQVDSALVDSEQTDSAVVAPPPESDSVIALKKEINSVVQEMFWRVRANDYSAFWDNEFPSIREQMSLDKYLTGVRFVNRRRPNSDSSFAIVLDSVTVTGDTALAYLTVFTHDVGADGHSVSDTATVREGSSKQKLYRYRGRWIRPLSTNPADNDEYYRQIRDYEEQSEKESRR